MYVGESSRNNSAHSQSLTQQAVDETPSLQITTHRLNGQNYLLWSQSVKMFVCGKGKLGYLTGSIQPPKLEDEIAFHTWEAENSMIMAWLVNSMEPDIGQTYLFLTTAKEMWDAVAATYSDVANSAQIFKIKTRIREMKQGNHQNVTTYFSILKGLWQELDQYYHAAEWDCVNDSVRYNKMLEKERVFEFLAGLTSELDQARGRVLGKEPLPSIHEVFAYIKREESMRNKVYQLAENRAMNAATLKNVVKSEQETSKKGKEKSNKVLSDHCNPVALHFDAHHHLYYSCINCQNPVALGFDLVSKEFKAKSGAAYLFSHARNIIEGTSEERKLISGVHTVADISCSNCGKVLGWKYIRANDIKHKYKEGKFILERAMIAN